MFYNFVNLKYFCDAVKLGGISAAAKANFVTQSAISQGIAKLEKSLGISLVAHHPNRFRLTPQGERVFEEAWEIIKRAAEFKDNLTTESLGNLEFACTYSFAIAVIPKFLNIFKSAHPKINVNFSLGKNADFKEMLKNGVIDFAIGPDEGDLSGFEKKEIYRGHFGLFNSSLLKKDEIQKLGFIVAGGPCKETTFFIGAYEKKFGTMPPITLEVRSWEVIANLTLEGSGIGYFPDYIAKKKKEGLVPYHLDIEPLPCKISAFYPKGMKLRKSSQIFLSLFD